jgi:hypothetical protein
VRLFAAIQRSDRDRCRFTVIALLAALASSPSLSPAQPNEQLYPSRESGLRAVHRLMDDSRERLTHDDTGSQTRGQQARIVEMLATLIQQAETQESNSQGATSSPSQQPGQKGNPDGQTQGPGSQGGNQGGGSQATDTTAAQPLTRGGPQSPWSQLRDKNRDPVYSAIKEKFPARYQQLLEQYYKSFQDESRP